MIRDLVDGRLLPCCSSGETIEIFVKADYETLPEERGRFAIVGVPRQQFSLATGNAARCAMAKDYDFHAQWCFESNMRSAGRPVMPQPLTDVEFESVTEVLERFGDKRSMSLETLDGFLAAVACGPKDIPQSEYLREIWGDEVVNEDAFLAQPLLREFVTLVMRHRDFIARTLESGDVFTPILLEDENGTFPANDWATGFLRGLDLRRKEWAPLLDDDEHVGALVPIFALAHEHDPDPKMRPYSEPVSAEMREKLIVGAAAGVMKAYRYFTMERLVATNWSGDNTAYRRIEPKVGRNEPCPCGSGKKFKKCCGSITFH